MTSIQQEERASGMGDANGGEARVVYLYSSPLVQRVDGRKVRMVQLDTEKDKEMIQETLKNAKLPIRFHAMVATPSCVGGVLNDGCQMIHYVGHGDGERLSFESDDDRQCGVMETFKVNALKNLLRSKHAKTQLVFISSCCSELSGNAFVGAGVPHVVAVKTKESVTDKVARLFSQEFYKALFGTQRHSVQAAFDIASSIVCCNTLDAGDSLQQGGPFILLPDGGNHDVPIFDQTHGNFIEETPPLPKVYPCLPRARDPYLGEEALQKVVDALVNPCVSCVTVVGGRGSGKTEMVIQACKYVRERRRFDVIFFATWDNPAWEWRTSEDLSKLVGQALGMDPAPSSMQQLADFLFKQEGRQPPRTVLLVLDGVGALVKDRDQEARDKLFEFFCSLCKWRDSYKLKLLVTGNVRLRHKSSMCFRPGSEQVLKVAPLEGTDPAQLFFNTVSRKLTRRELGVASVCSHDELLEALGRRLTKAKGHPETLVRLASSVDDNGLLSPSFEAAAVRIWNECNSILTSPSSTPTSNSHSVFFGGDADFGGGGNRGWEGGGAVQHPLPNDGGTRGASTDGPGDRHDHHSSRPPQDNRRGASHRRLRREGRQRQITEQDPRRYAPHERLQRETRQRRIAHQGQLQRSREYVDPRLCCPQHAPGTASEAELTDLGYLRVWVQAVEKAQADGRRCGGGDGPLSGDAVCGRTDRAPLKCLSDALREYLYEQQVISSSHCHTANDSLEMSFVEDRLLTEQYKVECGGGGTRASGPDDGDKQDMISIRAFVQFCKWWAPVMATLSQLRDDRRSAALVGMHCFVGRQAALEMLSEKEAGTFLLRFSETRAGALVISLKENVPITEASTSPVSPPLGLGVVNWLVEVDGGGKCRFIYELLEVDEGGSGRTIIQRQPVGSYTPLHDLILKNEMMRMLYPDIPKEEAFR